jgi:hypothetical protein
MPKSKRDLMKRQVAHAHNNLVLAQDHIAVVGVQFQGVHPELEAGLLIAVDLIKQADTVLELFVAGAWGREDPAWDSWRNIGTYNPVIPTDPEDE